MSNGFHACENPFDVLSYYPLVDSEGGFSRFAVVEQSGDISRHDEDSKIASATITIEAELRLPEFIQRAVSWIVDLTKANVAASSGDSDEDGAQIGSSGNDAQIGSSGNDAQIGSSGYDAQIGSSGYGAQIGSSGYDARIGSSGYGAQIGSSGNDAQIGSSGNDARIGSSGYGARIGSSGYGAQIGSSGYGARIDASGENSVIASAGNMARAKGSAGTWISLAEFDDAGKCVGFATGCVGQDGIDPDVWYVARGGKLTKPD